MRWLLLLVSIIAFAVAFKSGTPGALALSLLVAFGTLVAAFLGFAAARIEAQAQTQYSRAASLVATSRGKLGQRPAAAATFGADRGSASPHGSRRDDGPDAGAADGGPDGGGDGGSND